MGCWHIITSEFPPDVGGVSTYTRLVAQALARQGDDIHVWCAGSGGTSVMAGLHVHRVFAGFGPSDLLRASRRLDTFKSPRRLLVQWVPHGFGWRSMNVGFCFWLVYRAMLGDRLEIMVHEPFLAFSRGPLRHLLLALVHRFMAILLLRGASRVYVAIPAWETRLRPYAFGRSLEMTCLPVAADSPQAFGVNVDSIRDLYAPPPRLLIGHFGSYGAEVSNMLEDRLVATLRLRRQPVVLLIGQGSEGFRERLIRRNPDWCGRVHATGYVSESDLAAYLQICDVFVQPYPDGITARRTSATTCLSHARPVVTTEGLHTEAWWSSSGAVALVDCHDVDSFAKVVDTLADEASRRQSMGRNGRSLCAEKLSVDRIVAALRAA